MSLLKVSFSSGETYGRGDEVAKLLCDGQGTGEFVRVLETFKFSSIRVIESVLCYLKLLVFFFKFVFNIFLVAIHLSRIVVIEIFSFFSSKTDFRFEFLVKTYVYAGNFSLIQ